ncbi:MerR family transcriptional regulator, partial [Frankia sp. Cpl3]|nr:MerR family transcriptional regulator [Frankia sp. Cpl3]
ELIAREKTYTAKELADQLGIGMSTLRKWSALLEQNGYSFLRDSRGRREYRQADTIALRKMKDLTKESLMPLENAAAAAAASMYRQEVAAATETLPVVSAPGEVRRTPHPYHYQMLEQKVDSLAQHIQQQDAFNTALLERLD